MPTRPLFRTLACVGQLAVAIAVAPAFAAAQDPPVVERVNSCSTPRDAAGYVVNETICVLVRFDKEVEVTGATFTPDRLHPNPHLEVTIGQTVRQFGYLGGGADLAALS